jgi:hypothetical protein
MNRIRNLVRDYSPRSSEAADQAEMIGAVAVGTLRSSKDISASSAREKSKGREGGGASVVRKVTTEPTSDFEKTLKSLSVEAGLRLILTMIEHLRKDPERVFRESGAPARHPVVGISAFLRKMHEGILTKAQIQTESAFAANEAIPRTLIKVVSDKFEGEKEGADVDWPRLVEALKETPKEKIVRVYYENVIGALIDLVLDATRGRIPPTQVETVKQSVREHFVPKLIAGIKLGPKKQK